MLGVVMAVGAMGACKGKDKLKPDEVKAVTAKDQYAIDSARMELDRASAAIAERAHRIDVASWCSCARRMTA